MVGMRYFGGVMPALRTLLDEALALPAAERTTWLESLAGEQAQLKDTLRELLVAQGEMETGVFLATPPKLTLAGGAAPGAAELAAGDMIGPYRLISELGRGGMGTVWLAERADGQLKRQVALKLPHLAWGGALTERLARERDILASLEHAHIARLYDAGVDRNGPALPCNGVRRRRGHRRVLPRRMRCRCASGSGCCCKWPPRLPTRTRGWWCTAI